MPIFNNALAGAAGSGGAAGYEIERSLRFNSDDSAHLDRNFSSTGNQTTWTWSAWLKRTKSSVGSTYQTIFSCGIDGNNNSAVVFDNSDKIEIWNVVDNAHATRKVTSQVFRDFSSWYHFVISATDSTLKLYVNGVEVTDWDINNEPGGENWAFNSANVHYIGHYWDGGSNFKGDFLLVDVQFVDGQALAASDFGEYDANNVWQPKEYAGTYGPLVDQSQTWSASITTPSNTFNSGQPATSAADGVLSTFAGAGVIGEDMVFQPSTAVNYSNSVEVYISGHSGQIILNSNTPVATTDDAGWVTLVTGSSGSITSITIDPDSTRRATISAIRVDGKLLVDNGVSVTNNGFHLGLSDNSSASALGTDSSGNNNDWTVNNLTATAVAYSSVSSITVNNGNTNQSGSLAAVFNGTQIANSSNAYGFTTGAMDFTWSPNTAISYSSKVRVWTGFAGGSVYLNGGSAVSTVNNNWTTLVSGSSGTITSIQFTVGSGGGYWAGLEVDDVVLVDAFASDIDSLIDTPTNYEAASGNNGGNYATFNPLSEVTTTAPSNGNLDNTLGSTSSGTILVNSGKWYVEYTASTIATGRWVGFGLPVHDSDLSQLVIYREDGFQYNGTAWVSYGSTYAAGDIIAVAIDLDGNTVEFYKNGTSQGSLSRTLTKAVTFVATHTGSVNFGQRPFAYTPPTGYKALCTTNLPDPDPAIADGSKAMDVVLYTGNDSTQTISGLNFSPDFVWLKQRNGTNWHELYDSIRGSGLRLFSNAADVENSSTSLSSFNSDGFSLTNTGGGNVSPTTYAAWAWDAGTSTVSNTDGTITSQVRANPSAGFSIVSYTGDGAASATIGHGLNAAPEFIMVKNRDVADEGSVYHVGTDATSPQNYFLKLFSTTNGTAARSDVGAMWNDTAPTSSVFSVGTEDNVNASTENYIAYCFAPVEGYSAFGSYTGNGSADGPFQHLGFRPAWLLIKKTSGSDNWILYDTSRSPYNVSNFVISPNSSAIEDTTSTTYTNLDILSNGFKVRASVGGTIGGGGSSSADTYIYAAFAEHPFKTARAR